MNLEDNEEDCTIYIEELKSDDPNLKINAVGKITSIAEILGRLIRHQNNIFLLLILSKQDQEECGRN